MRESLTKTIENKRQMMITKLSKAKGREFQDVILLMFAGRKMDVGVADWLGRNGY